MDSIIDTSSSDIRASTDVPSLARRTSVFPFGAGLTKQKKQKKKAHARLHYCIDKPAVLIRVNPVLGPPHTLLESAKKKTETEKMQKRLQRRPGSEHIRKTASVPLQEN